MGLRRKRILIEVACHAVPLGFLLLLALVSGLARAYGASGFFVLLLLGYAITIPLNPLPRMVEKGILNEAECLNCGEVIDLLNTWSCGCGFTIWEPRHAFSPCAHCRKVFTWLVCPRCEGSIPI